MRRLDPAVTLSALALAMLAARLVRTSTLELGFLAWNLALAWAPMLLAVLADRLSRTSRALSLALGAVWWLFFPNAIYLVTDLAYAGQGHGVLRWYDTAMLAAFAFAGAWLAIASLERMRALVASRLGEWPSWLFAATVWLSSGFGVWLGRVRRWNSWDAILRPSDVLVDAVELVTSPRAHASAWVVTCVFAALLAALQVGARRPVG